MAENTHSSSEIIINTKAPKKLKINEQCFICENHVPVNNLEYTKLCCEYKYYHEKCYIAYCNEPDALCTECNTKFQYTIVKPDNFNTPLNLTIITMYVISVILSIVFLLLINKTTYEMYFYLITSYVCSPFNIATSNFIDNHLKWCKTLQYIPIYIMFGTPSVLALLLILSYENLINLSTEFSIILFMIANTCCPIIHLITVVSMGIYDGLKRMYDVMLQYYENATIIANGIYEYITGNVVNNEKNTSNGLEIV